MNYSVHMRYETHAYARLGRYLVAADPTWSDAARRAPDELSRPRGNKRFRSIILISLRFWTIFEIWKIHPPYRVV